MGVYTGSGPTDPVVGNKVSVTAFGVPSADAIQALASATSSYTPTIGGTGWVLGNGTLTGNYSQVGKAVWFRIVFTFGSTSVAGTGSLSFTTPVTLAGTNHVLAQTTLDASPAGRYNGVAVTTTTPVLPYCTPSAAGGADRTGVAGVPITWASGDVVTISGWAEAA